MINADMRLYDYFTLGAQDEYGQQVESTEPAGQIKIAINVASQTVQDNINYTNCQYVGLTHNKLIDDTWLIQYGNTRLKVLYVNKHGRLTQVFLVEQ